MYVTREAPPTQKAFKNMLLIQPISLGKERFVKVMFEVVFCDIYLQEHVKI